MLEQWNSGIMGSGMMQCWINGPATGGSDDKIKMENIHLIRLRRTIIPLFHFRGQIRKSRKNLYILSRL